MGGGGYGLGGYVYQQDYVAFRIMSSEARRILIPSDIRDCVVCFKVEGQQSPDGPVWDVGWKLENKTVHLRECKNTTIKRDDRKKFYARVRDEIAHGTLPTQLYIGWVTDPNKQDTNILSHLESLASLAASSTSEGSIELPNTVENGESALFEALFFLSMDDSARSAPIPITIAKELLSRLSIDRFRAIDLAASVELLAASVFKTGVGVTIRELIQGKLSTVIQRNGSASYKMETFLESVRISQVSLEFVGQFRDILEFHTVRPRSTKIPSITWACRPDRLAKVWSLVERLPTSGWERSFVLIAGTGVGKTATSLQMCAEKAEATSRYQVLRIEAGNVDTALVDALPRLCCTLGGVCRTWLAIDGLDQIPVATKQLWRQTLHRLLSIPNITVAITARKEVVNSHAWMQELLSLLPEVSLDELTDEQVVAEFLDVGLTAPCNSDLIHCLKNPFLFSVYARTTSDLNMPLNDQGEVTAFDVIRVFWRLRVTAESDGHRAVNASSINSALAKRSAVSYLAKQLVAGETVHQRPSGNAEVNAGIEMLCHEGVLVDHSTSTVVWRHAWFREYAMIDCLLEFYETPSVDAVALAVCGISADHVARIGAVGGCRWILSNPKLGRIESYISLLYRKRPGLAREALSVLLEGAPRYLELANLEPLLLLEALALALAMKAQRWFDQVTSLPESVFQGPEGSRLQAAAFLYESEIIKNE